MALTVAQLVARLTADTSGFYKSMAIANSSMLRTGSIITRVSAGAGLAVAGMGILSLRAAGNFQQSMNILGAVSEANTRQMDAMRKEAIALGADIKLPNVSAKDAAESMTNLAKAGLSVKDIMGATRGTLQLGIAANVSFADSANVVARALTAFHLNGTQAVRVADLFTAAANKSTADITDMALGFQMASAQFVAGDQTIEGLTTSLTLMANAGIVGSDAGTSLKTMMNRLMAPTKKSRELMERLGISIYDQAGNMRQMPALINQFNNGMQGMTKEQKNAALYTIFGSDAIRAARVQMNAGSKGWEEMEKRITKGGEAQKFAAAQTAGFNGALGGFTSSVETLAIQLGTAMLPAATAVVRAMTNLVNAIDPNVVIGFFKAIIDGGKAIYDFISGSDILVSALGGLVAGLIAYKTIVMTVEAVTKAWAAAQAILNAVVAANPIVLIIAALVALGVALVIAYQRSETFRNIVDAAFAAIKVAAGYVVDAAKVVINAFEQMYSSVSSTVRSIVAAVTSAWNTIESLTHIRDIIRTYISGVWRILEAVITGALNVIKAMIIADWNIIKAVTTAAWNIISAIITNVIGVITGKISAMTALRNIVSAVWNGIRAVTVAIWNGITAVVGAQIEAIKGILAAAAGAVWSLGVEIGQAIVGGILSGLGNLASSIGSKISSGLHGAVGIAKAAIGAGSPSKLAAEELGKPISDGIIMGFLEGSADLPTKMSDKLKAALEAGKRQVDAFQSVYSDAFSRLSDMAGQAFDSLTQAHLTPAESAISTEEQRRAAQGRQADLKDARDKLAAALADKIDFARKDEETDADYHARMLQARKDHNQAILDARQSVSDAEWAITKTALERVAETERMQYDAQRTLQKQHLDDQLNNLETALSKHPERHDFYQKKIVALLNSYGITYKAAGATLGTSFAKGLRESEDEIIAAARKIANEVARILKLNSPAKEGPLSDLDTWWKPFASTLVKGLDTAPILSATNAMAAVPGMSGWASTSTPVSAPAATGPYAGSTVIEVNNPQFMTANRMEMREFADKLREFLP